MKTWQLAIIIVLVNLVINQWILVGNEKTARRRETQTNKRLAALGDDLAAIERKIAAQGDYEAYLIVTNIVTQSWIITNYNEIIID